MAKAQIKLRITQTKYTKYLRGDLSSFLLFDFFDDELLDVDRELRSFFELDALFEDDDDDLDFELELLLLLLLFPNLPDVFDSDLVGERIFLCL